MLIEAYDPKKGYSVKAGETTGNIFRKEVTRSKHYFRLVSGYAIQKSVYEKLIAEKIKKIVIKEKDTGDILTSDIDDWKEHRGKGNWGHGTQMVLSEKYMQKRRTQC
jgi:hypothetical protein